MNSGTQAAKEAGNMVDLDSNPTKLIEVVEIGKQLLMTRGTLTTFSIANDVAKYFAIIPAAFATTWGGTLCDGGPASLAHTWNGARGSSSATRSQLCV
jgi:high-affinity K+ transport system ATPase subunit B